MDMRYVQDDLISIPAESITIVMPPTVPILFCPKLDKNKSDIDNEYKFNS